MAQLSKADINYLIFQNYAPLNNIDKRFGEGQDVDVEHYWDLSESELEDFWFCLETANPTTNTKKFHFQYQKNDKNTIKRQIHFWLFAIFNLPLSLYFSIGLK